jgi:hypothetical protein
LSVLSQDIFGAASSNKAFNGDCGCVLSRAEILAMPPVEPGHEPIREPEMRAVLREVLWAEQRKRWRALVRRDPQRSHDLV